MHKWWPKREGWSASCTVADAKQENRYDVQLNPNRGWLGSPAEGWSQMRQMRQNDWYILDIGKPRMLVSIVVRCDDGYPKKYRLDIRSTRDDVNWEEVGVYNGPINIKWEYAHKIIAIRFTIVEPTENTINIGGVFHPVVWTINDIRLTEVRLFDTWWKKVIEE